MASSSTFPLWTKILLGVIIVAVVVVSIVLLVKKEHMRFPQQPPLPNELQDFFMPIDLGEIFKNKGNDSAINQIEISAARKNTKFFSTQPLILYVKYPIVFHTNVGIIFENVTLKRSPHYQWKNYQTHTFNDSGYSSVLDSTLIYAPKVQNFKGTGNGGPYNSFTFDPDIIMLQSNCYLEGLIIGADYVQGNWPDMGMHCAQISLKGTNIVCQNVQVLEAEGEDPLMGPFGQGYVYNVDACFSISGKNCFLTNCIAQRSTYGHCIVSQGCGHCTANNVTTRGKQGGSHLPSTGNDWKSGSSIWSSSGKGQPAVNRCTSDKNIQSFGTGGSSPGIDFKPTAGSPVIPGSGWPQWTLSQDGFRTYGAGQFTCINCKAIDTRAGFQIWGPNSQCGSDVDIYNCCKNGKQPSLLINCYSSGTVAGAYQCSSPVSIQNCYAEKYYGPGIVIRSPDIIISGLTLRQQITPQSYLYNSGLITGPSLQNNPLGSDAGIYPQSGDIFIDQTGRSAPTGEISQLNLSPQSDIVVTILMKSPSLPDSNRTQIRWGNGVIRSPPKPIQHGASYEFIYIDRESLQMNCSGKTVSNYWFTKCAINLQDGQYIPPSYIGNTHAGAGNSWGDTCPHYP